MSPRELRFFYVSLAVATAYGMIYSRAPWELGFVVLILLPGLVWANGRTVFLGSAVTVLAITSWDFAESVTTNHPDLQRSIGWDDLIVLGAVIAGLVSAGIAWAFRRLSRWKGLEFSPDMVTRRIPLALVGGLGLTPAILSRVIPVLVPDDLHLSMTVGGRDLVLPAISNQGSLDLLAVGSLISWMLVLSLRMVQPRLTITNAVGASGAAVLALGAMTWFVGAESGRAVFSYSSFGTTGGHGLSVTTLRDAQKELDSMKALVNPSVTYIEGNRVIAPGIYSADENMIRHVGQMEEQLRSSHTRVVVFPRVGLGLALAGGVVLICSHLLRVRQRRRLTTGSSGRSAARPAAEPER